MRRPRRDRPCRRRALQPRARHRAGRDRPRGAAGGGPRRRSRRRQDQGVRPLQGRRPARGLEGLHQGPLPRARHSHRRLRPLLGRKVGEGLSREPEDPDRRQGRRPRRRQGRGDRRDVGAGGGRRRRLLRRHLRGGRRRDRHRGVPRGRGGERLCPRRRQERAPPRQRPGPQARRRRRYRPQHRRHGRLLAGPRHDARDDGAGDGRDHPPDRAGDGRARHTLQGRAVPRRHDHERRPQALRVQRALRRSRVPGADAAPQIRPARRAARHGGRRARDVRPALAR